jgi:hypothetical protein
MRSRIAPPSDEALAPERAGKKKRRSRYRTWAELLARAFGVDALACPVWQGRMRLVAVLEERHSSALSGTSVAAC